MTEAEAFRELRATLRKHGYFGRPTGRIVLELAFHLLIATAGVSLFLLALDWWWRACGLAALALGSMGVGTNTHTSSHSATSNKTLINEFLTYFGYPVCFGLSATYWRHKHVLNHHSSPNMKGVDGDFDLFPWFAGTEDDIRQSSGWRQIYYAHLQVLVFPIAVGLTLPAQQLSGAVHVIRLLRDRERRHSGHWIDLFCLLTHVAVCLVIPATFFSVGNVVAFYVVRDVINSYAMFVIFAPAHMPAAAARLSKDPARIGHPVAQALTTLNFKTGRLGKMMCSGLQYQIEHHLLPDVSHVYYPQVSVFVEEFCRKHTLPYRRYAWGQGIWLSLLSIRTPSPIKSIQSVQHSASDDLRDIAVPVGVDVKQGSENVYENGFSVNNRTPDVIQIVLSPVGSIDGVVRDSKQQTVAGAEIVIVPAAGGLHRTTADAAGKFAFPKVAVGEYCVYAIRLPEFPNGIPETENALRTFLGSYRTQSQSATVSTGTIVSFALTTVQP